MGKCFFFFFFSNEKIETVSSNIWESRSRKIYLWINTLKKDPEKQHYIQLINSKIVLQWCDIYINKCLSLPRFQ